MDRLKREYRKERAYLPHAPQDHDRMDAHLQEHHSDKSERTLELINIILNP